MWNQDAVAAVSAPWHCRHCREDCPAEQWEWNTDSHVSAHAQWQDGHCPACGEAERIAADAEAEAESLGDDEYGGWAIPLAFRGGLLRAAKIARGDV